MTNTSTSAEGQQASTAETRRAGLATRLAFFAAGFATACWAPLVPFAKSNVGADEAQFGLLLFCLGLGSVTAMPLTGWICARYGARSMMVLGGLGLGLALPFLIMVHSMTALALVLLVFGASLGTLDVAMNIHGIEVEARGTRPMMSGFHAMFSVGGFVGASGVTGLLMLGLSGPVAAVLGGILTLALVVIYLPRLLRAKGGEAMPFALPHSIVVLFAVLAGITFLVEGALLDWSALLVLERGLATPESAGLGFMLFSIAMTIGRLTGDRITAALGSFRILLYGGLVTMAGLVVVLMAPFAAGALAGFVLVGLGASNVVPVLFSLAGRQKVMPVGLAVAAVTTTGYAGVLMGPAAIGGISHQIGLEGAFWLLVVLMAAVPLTARRATKG